MDDFKTFKLVPDDDGEKQTQVQDTHEPTFPEFPAELQKPAVEIWNTIKKQVVMDISGALEYVAPPLKGLILLNITIHYTHEF